MIQIPVSYLTGSGEGNHFYSLYKDKKGDFWAAGTNGIIKTNGNLTESDSHNWYKLGNGKYSLPHNRIRDICEDKDNNIGIASDGIINYFERDKQIFRQINIIDSTHTYNSNWSY